MGTGRGKGEREEAKRSEGELMEESFGSVWQVTHRGRRRPKKILDVSLCLLGILTNCTSVSTTPTPSPQQSSLPQNPPHNTSDLAQALPLEVAGTKLPLPTRLSDCSVNARVGVSSGRRAARSPVSPASPAR